MKMFVRDQKLSETATGAGDGGGARKGEGGSGGKRVLPDTMCVCVCVCVRARARACVFLRERQCVPSRRTRANTRHAHTGCTQAGRRVCVLSRCQLPFASVFLLAFAFSRMHMPTRPHTKHTLTRQVLKEEEEAGRGAGTRNLWLYCSA